MMYLGPANLLGKCKPSVIDVGCGDGLGYHTLVMHEAVSTYFGIDKSTSDIRAANQYLISNKHAFACGDWLEYPEDDLQPADFVFCIEVLEHLAKEATLPFVEKCKRFMKKNIFLSTPPADRNKHGTFTVPECRALLQSIGLNVVTVDIQRTTLYICEAAGR